MRNSVIFGLLGLILSWLFHRTVALDEFYLAVIIGILLDIYLLLKTRYKH
jgi:hypothetical protein